ncbi:MAG: hypothetical protein M3071_16870, partial [Actinomycetota bacterium]|nr:hypothetical protein [Actinomycetota bacterium]
MPRRGAPRGAGEDRSENYVVSRNGSDSERDVGGAPAANRRDASDFYGRVAARDYPPTAERAAVDEEATAHEATIHSGATRHDAVNGGEPYRNYRSAPDDAATADEPPVERVHPEYRSFAAAPAQEQAAAPFIAHEPEPDDAAALRPPVSQDEPAVDPPVAHDEPAQDQGSGGGTDTAEPGRVIWHSKPPADPEPQHDTTAREENAKARAVLDDSPTVEIRALSTEEVAAGEEETEPAPPAAEPEAIEHVKPGPPAPEPVGRQAIHWPPRKPEVVEQVAPVEAAAGEPASTAEPIAPAEPAAAE